MKKPFIPKWMHYGTFHRRFLGPSDSKDLMGVVNALSSHLSNISGHLVSPICSLSRKGPGWEVEVSRHGDVELVRTRIAGGTTYILILYNSATWHFEYWDLGKLTYDCPTSLPAAKAGDTTTKEEMDKWLFRLWAGYEGQGVPGWESWYFTYSVAPSVAKWLPSKHMYFDEDNANKMSFYYKYLTSIEEYQDYRQRSVNSGISHNTAINNAIVTTSGGDPKSRPPTDWVKTRSASSNVLTEELYQTDFMSYYVISPPLYEKPPLPTETDIGPEYTRNDVSDSLTWEMERKTGGGVNPQYYHASWQREFTAVYHNMNSYAAGEMGLFGVVSHTEDTLTEDVAGGWEWPSGGSINNYADVSLARTLHTTETLYFRNKIIKTSNIIDDYESVYSYDHASSGYGYKAASGTYTQTRSGPYLGAQNHVSPGPNDFICHWTENNTIRSGTVSITTVYTHPLLDFIWETQPTGSTWIKGMQYQYYWVTFTTAAAEAAYAAGSSDFADVDTEKFKRSGGVTSIRILDVWYNEETGEGENVLLYLYMYFWYATDFHMIAMFCITGGATLDIVHLVVDRRTGKHTFIRTNGAGWGTYMWSLGAYIKGVGPDAKAIEI